MQVPVLSIRQLGSSTTLTHRTTPCPLTVNMNAQANQVKLVFPGSSSCAPPPSPLSSHLDFDHLYKGRSGPPSYDPTIKQPAEPPRVWEGNVLGSYTLVLQDPPVAATAAALASASSSSSERAACSSFADRLTLIAEQAEPAPEFASRCLSPSISASALCISSDIICGTVRGI